MHIPAWPAGNTGTGRFKLLPWLKQDMMPLVPENQSISAGSAPAGDGNEPVKHDILTLQQIDLSMTARSQLEAIVSLSHRLWQAGRITSPLGFIRGVIARENLCSTYCGRQIAIPHAISGTVTAPSLCIGRMAGIDWNGSGERVRLVFLLAVPPYSAMNEYASLQVEVLSAMAGLMLNEELVASWLEARSPEELLSSIAGALPGMTGRIHAGIGESSKEKTSCQR